MNSYMNINRFIFILNGKSNLIIEQRDIFKKNKAKQ